MSKKEELRKVYDEWEWDNKVGFKSFYQKTCQHPELPIEERIIPQEQRAYKYTKYVYKWRHKELWDWYAQQENPQVKFNQFVSRVRDGWYTREQALLTGEEWKQVMEEKAKTRVFNQKKYVPPVKKPVDEKPNDDYFFIKIKYPTKVARVFVKEYENLIEELEWKVKDILDKESRNKLEADIVRVRAELMVFKSYNKL